MTISRRAGSLLIVAILAAGCASTPRETHAYKLYPGPTRPVAELAVVRLVEYHAAKFDDRVASGRDWTEVHLLPVEHHITWRWVYSSEPLTWATFANTSSGLRVTLVAGHVYQLRTQGVPQQYAWIQDDTNNRVVAGTAPP